MKAITILSSYFYLGNFKYNKDSIMAGPERFTFPCMSPPFFAYFVSPATKNTIITFNFLNFCLYFP